MRCFNDGVFDNSDIPLLSVYMLCLSVVLGVFAPFDRTVTHVFGGFSCLVLLRVVWSMTTGNGHG